MLDDILPGDFYTFLAPSKLLSEAKRVQRLKTEILHMGKRCLVSECILGESSYLNQCFTEQSHLLSSGTEVSKKGSRK